MTTYNDLLNEFRHSPRDVITVPMNGSAGIWFYVFEDNGFIYVDCAKSKKPSSSIGTPRKLNENEFDDILSLYQLRKKGAAVAAEAKQITNNQVYWYGIFSELGL